VRPLRLWSIVAGAALLLACDRPRASAGSPGKAVPTSRPVDEAARPIELLTWWGKVGDSNPIEAFYAVHRRRYPLDLIVDAKTNLSDQARRTRKEQIESGEPPDVFQATIGKDHMQWVLTNGADARDSKVLALDDVMADDVRAWRAVVPARILELVSFDGKLYGLPATVHRINAGYANRRVFREHGLDVPRSVADLLSAAEVLGAAGVPLVAIGAREPWALRLLVFEGLLVALDGADFYESYLAGKERADDPRVLEALRLGLALMRHANADWDGLTWMQAAEMVARGKAAWTPAGDWAGVLFAPGELAPAGDVVETAFPGAEDTLVYTVDVFSATVAAKNLAGAERLLSTIGSEEGQRALSRIKGCLSPRSDVNAYDASPTQQRKARLLRDGRITLGAVSLAEPRFCEDVQAALAEMVKQGDVEPVVQTLRSRYRLLSKAADLATRPF